MRIFLILLAIFLAGVAGDFSFRALVPALLAGAVTYLLIEVAALRRRIGELESSPARTAGQAEELPPSLKPVHAQATEAWADEPEFEEWLDDDAPLTAPGTAAAEAQPPVGTMAARPDGADGMRPQSISAAAPALDPLTRLFRWFTGGNPVLKVGIVILFFGVAFLLSYAAQHSLLPIELRLAGVALGGLALLLLGWRLRHRHTLYGLSLEGGGVGVLYLVVFAAAKLYHLLPLPLALAVMIGLVGLSCALAILQNARGLAVAGSVGGFLAPVLMATGGGSHVLLFSYYALLNCGILAIAWFKSWRELNLTGFVFTFGIAALWGAKAYVPAHFATTEPFLILFFLMYCLISVLFAHRQPLRLRGYIDGPLVFGLPVVAGGLQACLVRDIPYGLAVSALALGGWYIVLARLLWSRIGPGLRLLTEAFLALGIVFASLAIPFGLDSQWTSAAWAIEGAAMVWVGVRQNRQPARIFGLLLQLGAAISFGGSPLIWAGPLLHGGDAVSLMFANRFFLGCGLIAIAALASSYWLDQDQEQRRGWERFTAKILLAWGLLWWYAGGIVELERHVDGQNFLASVLLFAAISTAGFGAVVHWSGWRRLSIALLLLLPLMVVVFCAQMVLGERGAPLLTGWGWLAWPLALALQYGLLFRLQDELPPKILALWHTLALWLLLAAVTVELARRVGHLPGLATAWTLAAWGLAPAALLFLLVWQGKRLNWPVARFDQTYLGIGVDAPLAILLLWTCATLAKSGNPAPLPYLPLANPLELTELVILLLAGLRTIRPTPGPSVLPLPYRRYLVAALAFLWLNAVVGRSVHFFADVPYRFGDLFASPILQAGIAALWSALALSLTVWGARESRRQVWLTGAWLLGLTVGKLFLVDLAGTGAIGRIISFLVVGLLMLVIGFFAPLPPRAKEPSA